MNARDRTHAGQAAAGADDHLAVEFAAQDRVGRTDVALGLGRYRSGLDPKAGEFHGGGRFVHDRVGGRAPVLQREVVMAELERHADHVGVEHAQRLEEQFLSGLVSVEDDDGRR